MAKSPRRAVSAKRPTTTPAGIADGPPAPPSHQDISARAYELFLRRGAVHGQDHSDWFAAERELALPETKADPSNYAG